MERLNELCKALDVAIHQMAKYGKDKADAEHTYRIAYQQEVLKLRDEGMPATLIEKVANGITADLRQKRDIADVFYKTAQEKINGIKKQIEVINDEVNREWSKK